MNRPDPVFPSFLGRLVLVAAILLTVMVASSCKKADSHSAQVDFESQIRPVVESIAEPELDPKTGFVTETFHLPVTNILSLLEKTKPGAKENSSTQAADPFGDPMPLPPSGPVHQALAAIGIPFASGTSASYDPDEQRLTVVQTPEAMGLIRIVIDEFREVPDSAAIRFEFYEVPALLSLRLEQSAAAHFDNTPEWDALQKFLGEQEIRLLEVAILQSRSGQRAKFEDGKVVVFRSGTKDETKDGKIAAVELFEQRLVGTLIETDLVIAADGDTMDVNFIIEYHSAPPEWIPTSSGPLSSDSPPATVFHVKKLITNLTIHDGQTRLLTSWTPTGKPEFADNNRRILVFVSANLQREH